MNSFRRLASCTPATHPPLYTMAYQPGAYSASQTRQPAYAPSQQFQQSASSSPAPPTAVNIPPGTLPPGTIVRVGEYEVRVDKWLSEGELLVHVRTARCADAAQLDAGHGDAPCVQRTGLGSCSEGCLKTTGLTLTLSDASQAVSHMSTSPHLRLPSPPVRPAPRPSTSSNEWLCPIRRE